MEGGDYQPMCVTRYGSCTAVFSSEYAHLLSHWGLVEKGGPWDLSLATLGAFNYLAFALFPYWPVGAAAAAHVLLAISLASCVFSVSVSPACALPRARARPTRGTTGICSTY